MSTSNLVLIWKVRMCGGAKRLGIGSERYIEVFYSLIVMMRPAPTLQLAFQMRTGVRHFEDRNIG